MMSNLTMSLRLMADSSSAISVVQNYVTPTMQALIAIASIASVFFIVYGGILYMTSSGRPEKLEQAKLVIKNTFIGIAIIVGAGVLTAILSNAMAQTVPPGGAMLPSLEAIEPSPSSNGLIDILIGAVTGLLNNIIQAVAAPFIGSLDFFTKETPLMVSNSSVFNLWLAMVGITDVLFVVVVALVGFHIMSASTFGFDEIDFKHLLPRIGLIFLLINTSIFIIDSFIELSNVLITAVGHIGGGSTAWTTLTTVVQEAGGQSVAALLVMLVFLIFSVILLIYYVGRLVTLFIGTVLSPLVLLIWLVPGFRDFSETAAKTFLTTVFVLFIHVVILQLASSLFVGMGVSGVAGDVPNVLMSMIVGLATVIALLKTQGLMMQFSYVSLGARSTRQLGTQFMNGVSYLGNRGKNAFTSVSNKVSGNSTSRTTSNAKSSKSTSVKSRGMQNVSYTPPNTKGVKVTRIPASTGTTYKAPKVAQSTPRSTAREQVTSQINKSNKENKQ
jgi:hypothetical protein